MPTIKRKVEMNLPELIEWGWKNIEQVERKEFKSNVRDSFGNYSTVQFSVDGYGFKTDGVSHKDTFTIEIEEPITKDTKLFLISRCIGEFGNVIYLYDRTTINSRLKNLPKDCKITHLYIENEDNELQLIWTKEKGLVE